MISQPPLRLKRAVQKPVAAKANVTGVRPVGSQPRSIPDAATASPAQRTNPLANMGLAAGLGATRKSVPAHVVKFERAPTASLTAIGLGVSRKAPSIVCAYGRADAPDTMLEAFASAGAHEFRREGTNGRSRLRALIASLSKGDTLMLASLADLCPPQSLPKAIKEIEDKGIHIVALDGGADTRTPAGRGKLANQIVTAKSLFGLRL